MINNQVKRLSMVRSYLEAELMDKGFDVSINRFEYIFESNEKHPLCELTFSCEQFTSRNLAMLYDNSENVIDKIYRSLTGLSKYRNNGNDAELAKFQFSYEAAFTFEYGIDGHFNLDLTDFDATKLREVTIEFVIGTIVSSFEDDRDETEKVIVPIVDENIFRENLSTVLKNIGLKNGTHTAVYYSSPSYANGRFEYSYIARGTYIDGVLVTNDNDA